MALEHDVQAMMDAGVPEEAIGQYVQEQQKAAFQQATEEKSFGEQLYEGLTDPRTAMQGIGGAVGTVAGAPAGPLGAVGGGALGSAIGGQAYDLYRGAMDWAEGRPATQTIAGQTMRAAEDVGMDLAVPAVAGKALSLAGRAGKSILSPVKTYAKTKVGPIGARALSEIEELEAMGLRPEIGHIDSPEAQALSQTLRDMPASSGVMAEIDRYNLQVGADKAVSTAQKLGDPVALETVGEAIQADAIAAKGRFHEVADSLYDKVAGFLPEEVEASTVSEAIGNIIKESEASPIAMEVNAGAYNLAKKAAESLSEEGTMSLSVMKQLKKLASGAFDKAPGLRDDSDRFLINLWKASDNDITNAALATGDKEAERAVRTAKDWWKTGMGDKFAGEAGHLEDIANIMKQTESGKVVQWLRRDEKYGVEKLGRVLNFVSEDTANKIRATAFMELGTPSAGQLGADGTGFSFNTFLTKSNKLSDSAKTVLFGKAKKEYAELLKASEVMKALERQKNFSGTARGNAFNSLFKPIADGIVRGAATGGALGSVKGAIGGTAAAGANLVVNRRMAKLISDPDFVKWLVTTGKKVIVKPTDIAPQLVRLGSIASRNPTKTEDYRAYMNALGYDTRMTKSKSGKTTLEVK